LRSRSRIASAAPGQSTRRVGRRTRARPSVPVFLLAASGRRGGRRVAADERRGWRAWPRHWLQRL